MRIYSSGQSVDVTDRAGRALGAVSAAAGATWDVSDRLARLLGVTRAEFVSRIATAQAFVRTVSLAPSVGNFSEAQLLNPAASGVTVLLYDVDFLSDTLDQHSVRRFDTALTLLGTGFNLALGGAVSLATVRTAQPAAQDGTELYSFRLPANTLWRPPLPGVAALDAGEGIVFSTGGSNERISCAFRWVEF